MASVIRQPASSTDGEDGAATLRAVAAEREACAQICEEAAARLMASKRPHQIDRHVADVLGRMAELMRARDAACVTPESAGVHAERMQWINEAYGGMKASGAEIVAEQFGLALPPEGDPSRWNHSFADLVDAARAGVGVGKAPAERIQAADEE